MTKGEIFDSICVLYAECKALTPSCTMDYPFNEGRKADYVRKHTKEKLEHDLREAQHVYDRYFLAKKREEYWMTEEGAKVKETLENGIEECKNMVCLFTEHANQDVNALVRLWMGEKWLAHVFNRTMEVELTDNKGNTIFGRSFTIYFGDWCFAKPKDIDDFRFEMNFGTTGSFSLENDNDMLDFLKGMSIFANELRFRNAVKNVLYEYYGKMSATQSKQNELENKLRNPFDD